MIILLRILIKRWKNWLQSLSLQVPKLATPCLPNLNEGSKPENKSNAVTTENTSTMLDNKMMDRPKKKLYTIEEMCIVIGNCNCTDDLLILANIMRELAADFNPMEFLQITRLIERRNERITK